MIEETEGREVKVSEEDVLRVARRMLPITNLVISKMTQLFSGEPAMTLKVEFTKDFILYECGLLVEIFLMMLIFQVAPFALIGAEYGYLITLWRLFALGMLANNFFN